MKSLIFFFNYLRTNNLIYLKIKTNWGYKNYKIIYLLVFKMITIITTFLNLFFRQLVVTFFEERASSVLYYCMSFILFFI